MNPHAQSCREQQDSCHPGGDPSKSPLHWCGTLQERQRCESAEKTFSAPKWRRWGGSGGVQAAGGLHFLSHKLFSCFSQICALLLIYTKGGHTRNAGELCSLSTLRFLFLISEEEIGHPFPPLHPHIQTLRAFTLFPPLSPTLHLGVGSCSLYANWGFKAGWNGDKPKPCRRGFIITILIWTVLTRLHWEVQQNTHDIADILLVTGRGKYLKTEDLWPVGVSEWSAQVIFVEDGQIRLYPVLGDNWGCSLPGHPSGCPTCTLCLVGYLTAGEAKWKLRILDN